MDKLKFPVWLVYKHVEQSPEQCTVALFKTEKPAKAFYVMYGGHVYPRKVSSREYLFTLLQRFEGGGYPGVRVMTDGQLETVTFQQIRDHFSP